MSLKKVLILSLIGFLVLALIFTLVFFLVLNKKEASKEQKVEYYKFKLDEMYTNIKESNNILKINITIEYTDSKLAEVLTKNKERITNDILELLRDKTIKDMSGEEGQQKARKDIQNKIVNIVESNAISNVYFTEFIIQ
ncbi:flagellar basal body-associated FliL family protein [Paramaledivibacter caminithermalis]|jgi:flagellar FliL protein|uniref:Flagellar protein FliL n=1 Tax=Paramaledivibacter caminithermalis (strain DSM 15212 / CIP 107654 / DViRD3) TaxID=1121301 RepID=A0A1M6N7B3_PARC5|nr:flagellar basal body-associated FliL family protein [Paramaledivibacter caminithermalis]SHJ91583.1 flagellar FliL protein [Paramaledivibacter caminithermalis DSM 15212]